MTTVFTNGCFDILHRGHVELLKFCSTLGHEVIVGLNSDSSVRSLKGSDRPINTEDNRQAVLQAIRWVDSVIIFNELTPKSLINSIKPDIIVKGSDYTTDEVVGSDVAKVVLFELVDGVSTTKTIKDLGDR